MHCANCNAALTEGTAVCPRCGQPVEDPYLGFSMAWYKFLINFALWASAAVGLIRGIHVMRGAAYGAYREDIFLLFPKLKAVSIGAGCVVIAVAFLAVVAAQMLRAMKKSGPMLLLLFCGLNFLAPVALLLLVPWATGGTVGSLDAMNGLTLVSLLESLLLFVINLIYFKKRAVLFHQGGHR